jgi:hypothetical protein
VNTQKTYDWRALTVHQPWAELLISGRKSIEIRSWTPDYRGKIWLHSGLKSDPSMERKFGFSDLYRGGFIGSIELTAAVPFTKDRWIQWRDKHLDFGEYRGGLVAWIMSEPRRFRIPVSGSGARSLFKPSPNMLDQLAKAELA